MKNQIIRKCIACKTYKNRDEFIKITLSENGVYINGNSKVFGRSVYVCKDENCVKQLLKTKGIKRGLKTSNSSLIQKAEELVNLELNELKKEIHPEDKPR